MPNQVIDEINGTSLSFLSLFQELITNHGENEKQQFQDSWKKGRGKQDRSDTIRQFRKWARFISFFKIDKQEPALANLTNIFYILFKVKKNILRVAKRAIKFTPNYRLKLESIYGSAIPRNLPNFIKSVGLKSQMTKSLHRLENLPFISFENYCQKVGFQPEALLDQY